jgi:16S rRNA (guanine(966)-N(2))-methyltransferase RsmD
MRVIAGSLKGRRLKAPTWEGLRPTSDKLRETLFNVLAPRISGARVLDGYAGTGAVGIEALSRGAVQATFVDRDRRAQRLIADNVTALLPPAGAGGCAIIRPSFDRLGPFDIVFLDPPYDVAPDDALAGAAALVAPGGVLVLEHAKRRAAPESAAGLRRARQIVAGDSALSFYER